MMTFFIILIPILTPTALLICMENTFWNVSRDHDGNFVESFKKSFTLYVESGVKNMMEAELDILRYEGGDITKEFKAEFLDSIIQHCLPNCKFHCFYLHLMHLTTFF